MVRYTFSPLQNDSNRSALFSRLILMDKLKKGRGVHWDIVLLSLLNSISGLFGGPWICAATVRAMSHLAALTVMSTTHAPGESPKIVEIKGNLPKLHLLF
jgi:hypothetical protein